jgi:hypothetical protein
MRSSPGARRRSGARPAARGCALCANFADRTGACRDLRIRLGFRLAPHESQQKPLKPGSAKARLADALGVPEIKAGEKPGGEG